MSQELNLEKIADKEKKDGLFCLGCKAPYSRIEELMYCPDHKEIIVHESCVREGVVKQCTTLGCGKEFSYFLKPKTVEEISAGIVENLKDNIISGDLQTQYEQLMGLLGERAKAALISIYDARDKLIISEYPISRLMGSVRVAVRQVNCVNVYFNYSSLYCDGRSFSGFFVSPMKKVVYSGKLFKKEQIILTNDKVVTCGGSQENEGVLFDDVLQYTKKLPPAHTNVKKNIGTLVELCNLPKLIKETHEQEAKNNIEQLKNALGKFK